MRMVRLAVLAVIAVAVGGAGYVYRDEVAQKLGLATASAAEQEEFKKWQESAGRTERQEFDEWRAWQEWKRKNPK